MTSKAFDQTIINPRERPLSSDVNQMQSELHASVMQFMQQLFTSRFSSSSPSGVPLYGVFGNSFRVTASGAVLGVDVSAGLGFMNSATDVPTNIDSVVNLDDSSTCKPVFLSATQALVLDAAPPIGQFRYDLIEVSYERETGSPTSRDVLDVGTGEFVPTVVKKIMTRDVLGHTGQVVDPAASTAVLSVKKGVAVPNGTLPLPFPTVTSGYQALALVLVEGGAAVITENKVIDLRRINVGQHGHVEFGVSFKLDSTLAAAPTNVDHSAPPGIKVAVRTFDVLGVRRAQVVVVCGNAGNGWGFQRARAVATVRDAVSFATGFAVAKVSCGTSSVDAALQTALADPAQTVPQLSVAVAQPYLYFDVIPIEQAAGVTSQAFFYSGDPAEIDVIVDFPTG